MDNSDDESSEQEAVECDGMSIKTGDGRNTSLYNESGSNTLLQDDKIDSPNCIKLPPFCVNELQNGDLSRHDKNTLLYTQSGSNTPLQDEKVDSPNCIRLSSSYDMELENRKIYEDYKNASLYNASGSNTPLQDEKVYSSLSESSAHCAIESNSEHMSFSDSDIPEYITVDDLNDRNTINYSFNSAIPTSNDSCIDDFIDTGSCFPSPSHDRSVTPTPSEFPSDYSGACSDHTSSSPSTNTTPHRPSCDDNFAPTAADNSGTTNQGLLALPLIEHYPVRKSRSNLNKREPNSSSIKRVRSNSKRKRNHRDSSRQSESYRQDLSSPSSKRNKRSKGDSNCSKSFATSRHRQDLSQDSSQRQKYDGSDTDMTDRVQHIHTQHSRSRERSRSGRKSSRSPNQESHRSRRRLRHGVSGSMYVKSRNDRRHLRSPQPSQSKQPKTSRSHEQRSRSRDPFRVKRKSSHLSHREQQKSLSYAAAKEKELEDRNNKDSNETVSLRRDDHQMHGPNIGPNLLNYEHNISDNLKRISRSSVMKKLTGIITSIDSERPFGFIQPDNLHPTNTRQEYVKFNLRQEQQLAIPPKEGDRVWFVMDNRKHSTGLAVRFGIEQYKNNRSTEELELVLKNISQTVSNPSQEALLELLCMLPAWECLGNCETMSDNGVKLLIQSITDLHASTSVFKSNFTNILSTLINTMFLHPKRGRLAIFIQQIVTDNNQELLVKVRNFMYILVRYIPQATRKLLPTIRPMISTHKNTAESFLFQILRISLSKDDLTSDDNEMKDLSLVPSRQEMLNGPLEGAFNLRPVIEKGPYKSTEDYLDTYFRLLRADCFGALNQGVRKLISGHLDSMNVNVYHSVKLFGIYLKPLSIAVCINTVDFVDNWDNCTKLKCGNLVCITLNGTFTDAIWAKVMSRVLLQQEQIVMLELCSEENSMEDADAISYLGYTDCDATLVESPTFYKAYEPVLRNLQSMEHAKLPFQQEFIQVKDCHEAPDFITDCTEIDGDIIYYGCGKMLLKDLQSADDCAHSSKLDNSQTEAVLESLKKRVAIIQGPPGTGKTFIGVKLVHALNSMTTRPRSPILLVTYKNHALDEFMKQMCDNPDEIVRVGGGQEDGHLCSYNLKNLKEETIMDFSLDKKINEFNRRSKTAEQDVMKAYTNNISQKRLTIELFVEHTTRKQLENLIFNGSLRRQSDSPRISTTVTAILKANKIPFYDLLFDIHEDDDYIYAQKVLLRVVKHALKQWLPSKNTFNQVKETMNNTCYIDLSKYVFNASHTKRKTKGKKKKEDNLEEDDEEEDDEELERRAASGAHVEFHDIIVNNPGESEHVENWMPVMFPLPAGYLENVSTSYVTDTDNLWILSGKEKVLFVQYILHEKYSTIKSQFNEELRKFKDLQQCKSELEVLHSVKIIQDKKLIGMTITGASIHCTLLSQLKPAIVIVEEAGEVMEAQLLGCLGPWVKQLILIGDHKQLRPRVENHELQKNYHLDISLMERLINNGLPFSTLKYQNRMRPEFADMLKDIYPDLETNLQRVVSNIKPPSAAKSMFFWTHRHPEERPNSTGNLGKGYKNEEEAERCVNLAMFFISQGHTPAEITILAAYRKQVILIRKKLKIAEKFHTFYVQTYTSEDKSVNIQSIDNFQGDENNIVIISLVRSNDEQGQHGLGFLNHLNRRCVAQSRAKNAMYFVGNDDTIGYSRHWQPLLDAMRSREELGQAIPLQCPNHTGDVLHIETADDIPFGNFCDKICNILMPCGKHECSEICHTHHDHIICQVFVKYQCPSCKTITDKKCGDDELTLMCLEDVHATLPCGHNTLKLCCEPVDEIKCKEKCTRRYEVCKHPCDGLCYEPCNEAKCKSCAKIRRAEAAKQREEEKKKREILLTEIEKDIADLKSKQEELQIKKMLPDGETAAEYAMVKDLAMTYMQPSHSWYPKINSIEKVINTKLTLRYLECRRMLCDPDHALSQLKFYGPITERSKQILTCHGFSSGNKQPGKTDLSFTTEPPNKMQNVYQEGFRMLLLCQVLVGKAFTAKTKDDINTFKQQLSEYDSFYIPRGVLATSDTFIVSKHDQALPAYIIHFEKTDVGIEIPDNTDIISSDGDVKKFSIKPERRFKTDALQMHFRIVESQFTRLKRKYNVHTLPDIKSIDYYVNPTLTKNFKRKEELFISKYKEDSLESQTVLAFHGTNPENIETIIKNNFNPNKILRTLHGRGFYFSEFPDTSQEYGRALLLCCVLPGKTHVEKNEMLPYIPPGCDSITVEPDDQGRANMLVIADPDQILPCYVVHI